MSVFRSSIRAALAISVFSCAISAQTVSPQESGTFRLSSGSTFSASAGTSAKKPKIAPALKLIEDDFREALDVVSGNHASVGSFDPTRRLSSAINGMLSQLDPHSTYFTPKEFRSLNEEHQGEYFGIGATIGDFSRDGRSGVYILSVKKNSPSQQAGLRFGDRIAEVDGANVEGLDSTTVRDRLRGMNGSVVTIKVERYGVKEPLNFKVRRAKLDEPSIPTSLMLSDDIGYIALTEGFHYTTAAEFDTALRKLHAAGMRSLIVDLRGNGGGLVEQAVKIAEKFLPAGRMILSQQGRQAAEETVWRSRNERAETCSLVLLVDGDTASASEIFAAAMQDNDRATIVGTRTFGKGLVQDVIPLDDGSGLVLTSERYYAPSGRSIQRDYSDGRLYDYFRHISTGALIDKPSFAAKTLKGRVVYGGDGIYPDLVVAATKWTSNDLRNYETAFFVKRDMLDLTSNSDPDVRRHLESFMAIENGNRDLACRLELRTDSQFMQALAFAKKETPR
jgi:carboxyl-terminal processing protease